MNMFKLCSIMILAMTSLYFVGCADSPNDVVVKYFEAAADGDFDEASEYITGPYSEDVVSYLKKQYNEDPKQIKEYAELIKTAMESSSNNAEINGDKAIIKPFDNDPPLILKKIDGKWKIYTY